MSIWVEQTLSDVRIALDDAEEIALIMGWAQIAQPDVGERPQIIERATLQKMKRIFGGHFCLRGGRYCFEVSTMTTPKLFVELVQRAAKLWKEYLDESRRELEDFEAFGVKFK